MRINWNVPEGRFFDTGLDRGVLYPKGEPPIGPIVATNFALNSQGALSWTSAEVTRNLAIDPRHRHPHPNTDDWAIPFGTEIEGHPLGFEQGVELKQNPDPTTPLLNIASYYNMDGLYETDIVRHFGAWVKCNVDGIARLYYKDLDGVEVNADFPLAANVWVWVVTPLPFDGFSVLEVRPVGRTALNSDRVWLGGVLASSMLTPYFDGDSPPNEEEGFTYAWEGGDSFNESIASAPTALLWESGNSWTSVAQAPNGGINFRTRSYIYGSMHHMPLIPEEIFEPVPGGYYAARFKIRRMPGSTPTAGQTLSASLWDGGPNLNATMSGWDGDLTTLPLDGSYRTVNVRALSPTSTSVIPGLIVESTGMGVKFNVTDFQIEKVRGVGADVSDKFFDGNSTSNAFTYRWVGDEYLSPSTKREILTKAVPWFGLQSVDEEGGEGAASYYIDGRPFLFLPKPKEYKATLKAITYPDAFSEIMGVKEIASGMYLDSQMGDSFDLSYRTLIGNAVSGTDHAYKIHLVYNCSVSPQALTYESLSNSINPTSFSWEIQAVPVPVEGFRSTAHIMIDTRNMDRHVIDAIEAMLYGGEDSVASMPSPQEVFDLLSFGDTILVIDNGDGTFDVIGAYENVYMIDDGVFQVDNIDGIDHGDGTFTISTTNE